MRGTGGGALEYTTVSGHTVAAVYSSVEEEFDAAGRSAAIVDVSCFGRLSVAGAETMDLLHRVSTADLRGLTDGAVADTLLLTAKGRLVDLVTVCVRPDGAELIVSPGAGEEVAEWISRFIIMEEVTVRPQTDGSALFHVLGPLADRVAAARMGVLPRRGATVLAGSCAVASAWTPRWRGLLLRMERSAAEECWTALTSGGEESAWPMGWTAFEAYRISRGIPGRGTEIVGEYTPYEISAMEAVSGNKGCYIGQEVVARIATYQKSRRGPAGFRLSSAADAVPVALRVGDEEVGTLTSQTCVHGTWIGLGTLRGGIPSGSHVTAGMGGVTATVHDFPVLP